MSVIKKSGVLAGLLALAACATNVDVEKARMTPVTDGSAFAKALNAEYVERASFEAGENDWDSVDYFLTKAAMLVGGDTPGPQEIWESWDSRYGNTLYVWRIQGDLSELEAGRNRLISALHDGNATEANPMWCAKAQAFYDHWVEQSIEAHQPDHIANAKASFEDAVVKCKSGYVAAPTMPGPFTVFFGFNSADVSGDDETVMKAAMAIKSFGAKSVTVYAHTDLSGDFNYNMALAQKRARAVVSALSAQGVPAGVMSTRVVGEGSPAVKTADGVKEARNRRADITLK